MNGQLPPSFRATNWVYVPSDQIAQFRIDSACEVAVWVNERRVVNGTFVAGAKRGERSIFAGVALERGWNRFDVNCRAAGSGDPPSFAAWLLTTDGRPIPGLAQSHTLPESHVVVADWKVADGSEHYRWDQVRYDWQRRLPVLDIGKATQIAGAKIVAHLDARDGCIAVEIPGRSDGAGYRKPPSGWNAESDRDVTFNNVMDWRREWCMGVPCDDGRQLLFARPAAIEAIIHCLKEADGAENAFNGRVVADRLLGRVVVPAPEFDRELIVFDVQIGAPATWPADEEDLLTPFGPFIPNSISIEPVGPPKPHVAD